MDILAHLERRGCLNLSSATTRKPEEQEGVVFSGSKHLLWARGCGQRQGQEEMGFWRWECVAKAFGLHLQEIRNLQRF